MPFPATPTNGQKATIAGKVYVYNSTDDKWQVDAVATNVASDTVTATGNITGGNLVTTGSVTATGNISGANITTNGIDIRVLMIMYNHAF